jgi:hypothetical protein
MQTGHHLDERRFSCAILPKKGGDLAGVDGDGNVVERPDARKVFGQVVGDNRALIALAVGLGQIGPDCGD